MRFGVAVGALVLRLVVVVRRHDLLADLLLSLVYVSIQLVPVFSDRELLVVVNRDVDSAGADWLVFWVVELGNVGVSQGLLGGQTLVRVEMEQVADQVDCFVWSTREHVTDAPLLGWRKRLEHC